MFRISITVSRNNDVYIFNFLCVLGFPDRVRMRVCVTAWESNLYLSILTLLPIIYATIVSTLRKSNAKETSLT